MRRAIGLSFLGHVVVIGILTAISLRSGRVDLETAVYSVSLIEYPTMAPLKALDVKEQIREPERVKPLPPVEVERVKTREKRVDVKEAKEVEVAKKTQPEPAVEGEKGTGVGGIRVAGKEFEYPHYFEIIRRRLQSNFENPYTTRGGEILKATVYFQITASGSIVNTNVERTSGFPAFDQAARRAVLASNPFPRLPDGYSGDILGVHCDFLSARE
jgi:TonB family protein